MPSRWIIVLASAIMMFAAALPTRAFELGARFDLSNLDFARDRASTATTLPGDTYLWGITMTGHQQLAGQLVLDLEYSNDPILRNTAYTLLGYEDQFFSIRLGPFFGVFNSPGSILQSGLSTTVELFIPGITVVTLRSDNSLSGRLIVTGDYIQEQSELSVGFFVPNAIPTVYVRTKRYTWKTDEGETVDSWTAYGIETDIFQKNIPYRLVLDFAYQTTTRSFVTDTTVNHGYGAIVLGTELSIDLLSRVGFIAKLESSVYTFGREVLVGETSAERFLFRLSTGFTVSF